MGFVSKLKKIVLPSILVIPAFYSCHHSELDAHFGIEKTYNKITETFYFPGIYKWVDTLVRDCLICQTQKHKKNEKIKQHQFHHQYEKSMG